MSSKSFPEYINFDQIVALFNFYNHDKSKRGVTKWGGHSLKEEGRVRKSRGSQRIAVNTEMFIRMHDEAFTYFDGFCEECVYDQTKLVTIREEFLEVWLNERFYQYSSVVQFDIRVREGYNPESKGKFESSVKYVKNNFSYGDTFDSFDQLKIDFFSWVNTVANNRIHGTTKKRSEEVYSLVEQSKMKPYLPPMMMLKKGRLQSPANN